MAADPGDWATRLAAALTAQLSERVTTFQVHAVEATSPDVVDVIYSDPDGVQLKGVRVDAATVHAGAERIKTSSVEELAFDVITLGMGEPRSEDEFLPPDHRGIRWLPAHRWLYD